jgi:hypothetical protein
MKGRVGYYNHPDLMHLSTLTVVLYNVDLKEAGKVMSKTPTKV